MISKLSIPGRLSLHSTINEYSCMTNREDNSNFRLDKFAEDDQALKNAPNLT